MLGALGLDGVRAIRTNEGGTSGEVFLSFAHELLVPRLTVGDVVVIEILGAYHATRVRAAIKSTGARVVYLTPYSPDLNPIELCWRKVKILLRFFAVHTIPSLVNAVADAVAAIILSDARARFAHAGYPQCACSFLSDIQTHKSY